jgi:hypothetical protein
MMIHLIKLAVGVRDIAHLAAIQTLRAAADPPLRHQTRSTPKRAAELTAGGSIYWVIAGLLQARQLVRAVVEDRWDDETRCAGLVLDPRIVRVEARPVKAFQGWRYLSPTDAPADITGGTATDGMPPEMRAALTRLSLL